MRVHRPFTLIEEDALVLLMPLAGSRLVGALLGRSKGAVIGRFNRLKRPTKRKVRPSVAPRFCAQCGDQLLAYHRRYCSRGCARIGLAANRCHPALQQGRTVSKAAYSEWYFALPEVRERHQLLDRARHMAKKRKCSVREVVIELGGNPGNVRADYGVGA